MAIKTNLSRIMGERRIKQSELSRISGVDKNTIGAVYRDEWKQIGRKTLDRICKALNVNISELLDFVDER